MVSANVAAEVRLRVFALLPTEQVQLCKVILVSALGHGGRGKFVLRLHQVFQACWSQPLQVREQLQQVVLSFVGRDAVVVDEFLTAVELVFPFIVQMIVNIVFLFLLLDFKSRRDIRHRVIVLVCRCERARLLL